MTRPSRVDFRPNGETNRLYHVVPSHVCDGVGIHVQVAVRRGSSARQWYF